MTSNGVDKLTEKARELKVTEQRLHFAPKVVPGKRSCGKQQLSANVFGLIPDKNVPIYRYDFRALEVYPPKKGSDKPGVKEVTKQTREDYISIDRKNKCVAIFTSLLKEEPKFFGDRHQLVYDRASILYSLKKLQIEAKGAGDEHATATFHLSLDKLPTNLFNEQCQEICVTVKACSDDFQLSTNDIASGLQSQVSGTADQSLKQYFEVLTAQETFFSDQFVSYGNGDCFLMDPYRYGFEDNDMPPLTEGKYVGMGASKSVRLIEGAAGKGNISAALCIDVKKAAFHVDNQKLLDKIEAMGVPMDNLSRRNVLQSLNRTLKGLYLACNYGKHHTFAFAGFAQQNANTLQLETSNGVKQSVAAYFANTHKIKLAYPNLPLVIERRQPGNNCYPIELLVVCENQRVKQSQQTPAQVQKMIRACATLPKHRLRQTFTMASAMKLDGPASAAHRWLKGCNVRVTNNLSLEGRVLPAPTIEYGNGTTVNVNGASWIVGQKQYYKAQACKNWNLIALLGARERRFDDSTLQTYKQVYLKQCHARGMSMSEPSEIRCVRNAQIGDVDACFTAAKKLGISFIHFITSDDLPFHAHMKKMEVSTGILTQDCKASNASAATHKPLTTENIVNKTNLKLGGLNFVIHLENGVDSWLSNPGRLIIGLDIAHPPAKLGGKQNVPSVIGYSANSKKHPMDFIGGYRFGMADSEQLADDTLTDIVLELMHNFRDARGKPPSHLLIVRDGISEGQYKYVLTVEVELIKKACKKIDASYRPHITFVVLTKSHNMRIYKQNIGNGKAAEQNIPPGTVVDQFVVNPVFTEFYLNSHLAFQGTTKTPRYTLIFDTSSMLADELQGLLHALAYNFQIVSASISCPSPVMIAKRMSQRGRSNLATEINDELTDMSTGSSVSTDMDRLNIDLSYKNKALSMVRFNA